ncbi:MAG TPA: phosphoribosylamine--glycine ligase [Pyrinomonadaceae bacterium]|nr:phosphoribosylamine--glycine ligase [Pyrinomonadaceae bacterium]
MKILVVGSGGREHAICSTFARSSKTEKLYCADGNAGIAEIAECVNIKPDNIDRLAYFAEANKIDLTFVGGEVPLALGISDEFEKRGLKIVGVNVAAAQLEASKAFAKDFMRRHHVPTAKYHTANSKAEAVESLESGEFGDENSPVVVKADGLAAGKGVVVAADRTEALAAIEELEEIAGAKAAGTIVLEECLSGREVSVILFSDGKNFALMPPTRDHKRIGEGDTGPNTGGMGTITDAGLLTDAQTQDIIDRIIKPTLRGCRDEGFPLRGILFLGLMMTETGPKLLEYNVRFGDPETQSILIRLETDFVDICQAILAGQLNQIDIKWRGGNSACIILAADGYPYHPRKGDVIHGLDKAGALKDVQVFHSGTAKNDAGNFVTAGGRVLGVTASSESLDQALARAYEAVGEISWNGMQYRRDIGK